MNVIREDGHVERREFAASQAASPIIIPNSVVEPSGIAIRLAAARKGSIIVLFTIAR